MPYCEFKTAKSVLDALGATWSFQDDKKALKANLDVGNDAEEVEWEVVLLELPDGGAVDAFSIGSGSLIWEEV